MPQLKIRLFCAICCLLCSLMSFAAIDALNFTSPQQEEDYHQLTQELRCPQCQNNNIADSNATIAVDMRAKVFELLNEGKSKQDIINYMVERYGNFVTYNPPLTPATLLLWIMPLGLIIGGIFWLFRRKRGPKIENRRIQDSQTSNLTEAQQQRLHQILQEKE